MPTDPKRPSAERDHTDHSLRSERSNTDRALAQQQADAEHQADRVIERARHDADDVLRTARDKADHLLDAQAPALDTRALLDHEREVEDDVLRDERAAADATLRREREEGMRALMALLPLERETTDRHLLTERVRADDAISYRDDFLNIVSHDLRDLLSGIVLATALLSKRAGDDARGRDTLLAVERIQRYAARMNRLICDLVDIASIDAGKLAVAPERGDVGALLAEIVDSFRPAAAAKNLVLEAGAVDAPLPATFDHYRLLQVLANLVTNSIKFTPAGGRIRLDAERSAAEVRVSVSDTGCGIPADMADAVFERFQQVAAHDRRGLGLGLYISRCIIGLHGGRIWADSSESGGTAIHFTLPAVVDDP